MLKWGSALFAICCVFVTAASALGASVPKKQSTIAVPKFSNITGDEAVDWLSSGFAETLSTKLAGIGGLRIVERAQLSEAIKELKLQASALADPSSAKKLGLFVGAEYVIVGSFQRVGDKIKADARQIEVETARVVGAVDVTGNMSSVLELQSMLATKLIGAMGRTASETEIVMLAKQETKSVPAYEWNARGSQQNEMGNYDSAIASFTRALQLDTNYAAAYFNRGLAYYAKKDLESAAADYTQAIRLDSNYLAAYVNRGAAYLDMGQSYMALDDFNTVLKINADYPEALNNRANAYKRIEEYQKALADYAVAIRLTPKDSLLYYNRANLYMVMRKYALAEGDYTKAIELNPEYEQAYNNRGSCMSRQGQVLKAMADYKKAISINPDYSIAHYNLGVELEGAGKISAAVEAYREFLRLADSENSERIQKALDRIQKLTKDK